jgi:hypothetical protein
VPWNWRAKGKPSSSPDPTKVVPPVSRSAEWSRKFNCLHCDDIRNAPTQHHPPKKTTMKIDPTITDAVSPPAWPTATPGDLADGIYAVALNNPHSPCSHSPKGGQRG